MYLRLLLVIFLTSVIFTWFLILLIVFALNSPDKPTASPVTDLPTSYVNATNWHFGSFIIDNSLKCSAGREQVNLLVLVHSSVTHFDFRQLIRKHNRIKNSVTIFLLGFLDDPGMQSLVEEEWNRYGDIVQASFLDSYANLTLKHIMGLTWTVKFCSQAQLVIKMDDDIFVNYPLLEQLMANRYPESKYDPLVSRMGHKVIACYIQHKMKVIRNITSRWYVSDVDYDSQFYPDFCSGWAYITSVEVAVDLLDQIPKHPLFWIDDVYITGILRQSAPDIELDSLNKFFNVDVTQLYHWVTDSSLHKYKWRYVFSNANGDISLLSSALSVNDIPGHQICCYPSAVSLNKGPNGLDFIPKTVNGFAKRISVK